MTGKLPAGRLLVAAGALVIVCTIATACGPAFRDGFQVEGVSVGNASWTAADCRPEDRCDLLIEVATSQLVAREPGVQISGVQMHDVPHETNDGQVFASSLQTSNVVFTLADGSRKLETFTCGLNGEIVGGASDVYRRFCPLAQDSPWTDLRWPDAPPPPFVSAPDRTITARSVPPGSTMGLARAGPSRDGGAGLPARGC